MKLAPSLLVSGLLLSLLALSACGSKDAAPPAADAPLATDVVAVKVYIFIYG